MIQKRGERLCAWMVLPGMAFFGLAMTLGLHFIPPLSPQLNGSQIAAIYRSHAMGMRAGAVLMLLGGAFLMPFVGALYSSMLRMAGEQKALAATQLAAGVLNYAPLYLSGMFFAAASFRGDRGVEEVLSLSDLGWLFLVMPTPASLVQLFALGVAILRDDPANPVFPRWIAYLNFWVAILSLPGVLIPLFVSGPFAWDGLLAFWVPLGVFGPWMMIMLWAMVRSGSGQPDRR